MRTFDHVGSVIIALCGTVVAFGHSNNTRQALQDTTEAFIELAEALPDGKKPRKHGNNPWAWVGVNIGGEFFAMPGDEYLILAELGGFGDLALMANNAGACADLSILICGEGQICCFCYSGNGNQSCSFSCRDESGNCEPCPPCGPDLEPDFTAAAE